MSHMVMFRSAEGKSGYHQTESLDEAVRFVEHLRNQEQVPEARIFRMQEVPIEVKTYYKVEVSPSNGTPESAPPAVVAPSAPPSAPPAPVSPAPTAVSKMTAQVTDDHVVVEPMGPSNGAAAAGARFGRFNRS